MNRVKDLHARLALLNEIISVVESAAEPMSAREIQEQLIRINVNAPKKIINSILFSEGSRYVVYDKKTFKYSLREYKENDVKLNGEFKFKVQPLALAPENVNRETPGTKIFIRNREYELTFRPIANRSLFSVVERGAKALLEVNSSHPLYKKYRGQLEATSENTFFKELLIALANQQLACPNGKLRDRVEEFTYQLSQELSQIISEEQN